MIRSAAPRLLALGLAAGLSVSGAIAVSAAATRAPRRKPHLSEHRIVQLAERAAARAGDPSPTLIQRSEGTRHDANLVDSGDIVPGRRWSYLIAEPGHFVFKDAPTPPGAPAPTGTGLTLIVNASTGEITDTRVSDRYPHLARLGPVHTDLRR
jgi:hypothetical protein